MLSIGNVVECLPPLKPGRATVVDVFPKGVVPDKDAVEKYYSFKPGERTYGAFRATKTTRWILKRDSGGHIILPENWLNAQMFKIIS